MPENEKRIFLELAAIINWYDPIELLGFGCPESEYFSEIDAVFSGLEDESTEAEILDLVYNVFVRFFSSTAGPKRKYKRIAKEIHKCIVKNSGGI